MVPTSEESCEVAEELRDLVSEHCAVQCDAVAHVLGFKYEVHGCIAAFSREDVTALADLIDPMCHAEPMGAMGKQPYYNGSLALNDMVQGCSKCGYPFGNSNRGIGNPRGVPNYCPNCGARVVTDDGI